jgi:hypothetical protein
VTRLPQERTGSAPRWHSMRATVVGVVDIELSGGRRAVALLLDNMRWVLNYSDYSDMKKEIGSTVEFTDLDEVPALLN